MLCGIWLHFTKVNFFNGKEYTWTVFRNGGSLTWIFPFFFTTFNFWSLVDISLALNCQINWWLSYFLIGIVAVDLNVKGIELSLKRIEIAIDEVSHLLVNRVFRVDNIEDFIKGTDFLVMLFTCNFVCIDFILDFSGSNVLQFYWESHRFLLT